MIADARTGWQCVTVRRRRIAINPKLAPSVTIKLAVITVHCVDAGKASGGAHRSARNQPQIGAAGGRGRGQAA